MRRTIALAVIIVTGFYGAAAAMSEQEKIGVLLDAVQNSNLTFIRNGVAYSSVKAREHMEYKLKRTGKRIRTADQFIRYIASRSSITGVPYYIVLGDGTKMKAEDWLHEKLRKLER